MPLIIIEFKTGGFNTHIDKISDPLAREFLNLKQRTCSRPGHYALSTRVSSVVHLCLSQLRVFLCKLLKDYITSEVEILFLFYHDFKRLSCWHFICTLLLLIILISYNFCLNFELKLLKVKPLPQWRSANEVINAERKCRSVERWWSKIKLTVCYEIYKKSNSYEHSISQNIFTDTKNKSKFLFSTFNLFTPFFEIKKHNCIQIAYF